MARAGTRVPLDKFPEVLRGDLERLKGRVLAATRRAASRSVEIVAGAVPVAFKELADSVHDIPTAEGAIVRADAPHAAAVENGARAHMPPVEPIERWVRLRGMQGLGGSRLRSARFVAKAIARLGSGKVGRDAAGRFVKKNTATPIDAPRQIAWAIAMNIKQHGTKPQPYMRVSLPFCVIVLDDEVVRALDAE